MKMIKLMMATAFATGFIMTASMESAEAGHLRGDGIESSGGRTNDVDVRYMFELYEITPTDVPRTDEDGDFTNNIGRFTGAIEEFQGTISDVDDNFQFGGGFSGKPPETLNDVTLDLTAKLILADDPILLPDSSPALFLNSDGESGVMGFKALQDRIEYTLTGSALEEREISELTLIIENLNDIDTTQAVNSIDYIIDNLLLGKINLIRVSGEASERVARDFKIREREIISSENGVITDVEDDRFPRAGMILDRVVEVPESSTTSILLALGTLAAGLSLKRKLNLKIK